MRKIFRGYIFFFHSELQDLLIPLRGGREGQDSYNLIISWVENLEEKFGYVSGP